MKLEFEIADKTSVQRDRARAEDDDAIVCELALTPTPASVRVGRQFAARTLTEWDVPPEPIQDAVMIVSELVTNAICHGRPPVRLRLRKARGEVAIEVDDGDVSIPRERRPTLDSLNGRGLGIVSALSRHWTADATGTGKTVCSVIAV